jgi:hypothetical protein
MSFIFVITLSKEDALNKEDLNRWHPIDSKVELSVGKSLFSKRGRVLSVQKRGKGMQGLLTDNADPHAEFWDIEPELLPDLAKLMKLLRENVKSCFILEACWFAEGSSEPIKVSVEELTKIIEEGRLSTKANFLVC